MTKKYFGTDGIRGKVGESFISPEFVLKLGWAVGRVLVNGERKKVLIGKDTRVSGYMLESALEAGLSAAGVDIKLLGPMPTPAIAYLTQTFRANAGIVISASHNPFYDNGIKFFSADGSKLSDELELAIERQMDQPMVTVAPSMLGKAMRIVDAPGRYIEFCKSRFPSEYRLTGLKIVLDCANGATYHIAPMVFKELGATVIQLGVEPDGFNINEQCGSTSPQALAKRVVSEQADLGIAFDGDGDRVILVDEKGHLIDGDQILAVIAQDRHQRGENVSGVVGTVMSNMGLEVALQRMGIEFHRAQVGDRYVCEALKERGWLLGGESSGHIICADMTTTGDGITSSLQVLAALKRKGLPLSQLASVMKKFPQAQINVKTSEAAAVLASPTIAARKQTLEQQLGSKGRILLRPSGTEPLVRIMVQGESAKKVKAIAEELAQVVTMETATKENQEIAEVALSH